MTTIHFASSTTHAKCNQHQQLHCISDVHYCRIGKIYVYGDVAIIISAFRLLISRRRLLSIVSIITFRVSRRRRVMYCGHVRLCVGLSVCVSVCGRMPTLLHGPGCNLGSGRGCPLVVHYLCGFVIGARVALLWQHNANPSYKLESIP